MNTHLGLSRKSMNPERFPRSCRRVALLAALGGLPLLAGLSAHAADSDQPIVASLNPPPAGLACDAAAAATSVYFQFANPPFQVSQVSLYLDGKGVSQDAIDEHWPTVTMSKGLHPGTNTVDIVANGDNGQHIERRMIVQVGGSAAAGNGTAQVACGDTATVAQAPQAVAAVPPQVIDPAVPAAVEDVAPSVVGGDDPEPVVVQDAPTVIYDTPPPTVVYDYPPPVYVYNPYPVVAIDPWIPFVPFFSFGFFYSNYHPWCPPPQVVYNNYYHGGGWNGGGWHGNPGNGGWNGGGWHGNPGGGGWNGGVGRGPSPAPNPGWHGAPRPGPAPQPAFNGGGGNHFSSPPNRGWNNAPRPMPRPMPAQQNHQAWQGGPQRFAAAPQFRPMPQQNFRPMQASAPAFHGGGGFGGGFHGGAPSGGFHGGGPSGGFHGGGGGHSGRR